LSNITSDFGHKTLVDGFKYYCLVLFVFRSKNFYSHLGFVIPKLR
jgi:hypothetical protein